MNDGKVMQEFLSEAQELVEGLSRNLLGFDRAGGAGDHERVNEAFRAVHSLKGLSGLFGLAHMTGLSHTLEDLLDSLRLGKVAMTPVLLDLLFEAIDVYGVLIADASAAREPDGAPVDAYLERLERAARGNSSSGGAPRVLERYDLDPAIVSVLTEYEEHRLRENVRLGRSLHQVRASFDLATIDTGLEALKALLKPLGEVLSYLPSNEPTDDTKLALDVLFASDAPMQLIQATVGASGATVVAVPLREGASVPPAPAIAAPAPAPALAPAPAPALAAADPEPRHADDDRGASLRSVAQTVRVDIRKLDHLMNVVGELDLARAGIMAVLDGLRDSAPIGVGQELVRRLQRETRVLERKLDELQEGILEVRMVPLGQVFDKLSRVVRKISRDAGKEIRFQIDGADTELDKLIVEELSDPLMHILRNAIDHGVEDAETRRRRGKPEHGTIKVTAQQRGNHVVIEIRDDGGGFDEERILDTALRKQLIDTAAATELSRRDLLNLVFLPGFSTREEAGEFSGRGVGMDVVKTNIAKLSGIIDLRSTRGQGTEIAITLPITLAIIPALIIRVAGHTYALPLNSVLESLAIEERELATLSGREVIGLRGQTLPLLRLDEVFRIARPEARPPKFFVVVVGLAQHRMGIVVDELVGQQDIVIKSLGRALGGVAGIAGATELEGQKTVLVLDVAALCEEAFLHGVEAA